MSLAPGVRLGPYEVLAPVGAGRMGEGYRAHDARLGGIWRVSANGGMPENIIKLNDGEVAQSPQVLPGGRAVLFALGQRGANDRAQVVVQSLDDGTRRTLISDGTNGRYLPTGHLVYTLRGTLLAVPFDLESLQVNGGPAPLLEEVQQARGGDVAQFAIAASGTLVYVPAGGSESPSRTLVWVDRQGREQPIAAPPRPYLYPRLSPDGTRVALDIAEENRDIWVWDLARGTLSRLTADPSIDRAPVWTPDSRRIIFSSDRAGTGSLFWQPADGTGDAEQLTQSTNFHFATSVSPDGRRFLMIKNRDAPEGAARTPPRIIVVQNWFEELKRLVPTR